MMGGIGAAQQRSHAGLQFGHPDRLGHEVVRTGGQPFDQVLLLAAVGDEQDGHRVARVLADPSRHARALDVGQPPIEDQQVVGFVVQVAQQRLAVDIAMALVANDLHRVADQLELMRLVIECRYTHSIPLCLVVSSASFFAPVIRATVYPATSDSVCY